MDSATRVQPMQMLRRIWAIRAVRFVLVGAVTSVAYALLYSVLRPGLGALGANVLALVVTGVANTAGHSRLTFPGTGGSFWRQQAEGGVTLGLGLVVTSGSLLALGQLVAEPTAALESGVLVLANVVAAVLHYVMLRDWVFSAESVAELACDPLARFTAVGPLSTASR